MLGTASPLLAVPPAAVPATGTFSIIWLLLAFPLVGAVVLLLGGRRTNPWGHVLGTLMSAASFVVAVVLFVALHGQAARAVDQHLFTWIAVGRLHVEASLLLDQLSMVFVLLITGVGTLVHLYSVGYMSHDRERRRFFAYLNLFVAAMLLLVLGDSFLTLYVGWEGVGLASYLLIAFWAVKPAAATAAKKAFVVNRVGDVGLSLAILILFAQLGRIDYAGVFAGVGRLSHGVVLAVSLLLLLGACGKSAQAPLHVWLPDAMEGPTPASALIHAATMVTAGVYLIARTHPLFDAAPGARLAVCIVGVVTLLVGCVIGCAYDDIKKVLAYSTISQIGYMFLAVGLGPIGYAAAILHLLTHGFFKAGLFMGAGSVMHATGDQVDMRRFGGLWRSMPITFWTMVAGWGAIIGFPLLSGFWSKDLIIETAFHKGGTQGAVFGVCALLGAGITAFYMSRLMAMTFLGRPRYDPGEVHPHESPWTMTVPMVVLAVGSVVAGGLLRLGGALQHWLDPVVNPTGAKVEEGAGLVSATVLLVLTLLVVAFGVAGAYVGYVRREVPVEAPTAVTPLTVAARHNLYADAFYETTLMKPGIELVRATTRGDARLVDGLVVGVAAGIGGVSSRLRFWQTGFVRSYALTFLGGAVLVVASLLLVRVS